MSVLMDRRPRARRRLPIYIGDPERIADHAIGRYLLWLKSGCCQELARELATRDAVKRSALERFRTSA